MKILGLLSDLVQAEDKPKMETEIGPGIKPEITSEVTPGIAPGIAIETLKKVPTPRVLALPLVVFFILLTFQIYKFKPSNLSPSGVSGLSSAGVPGLASLVPSLWTPQLTKDQIAEAFGNSSSFIRFPVEIDLNLGGDQKIPAQVQYSFDAKLQKEMEALFGSYMPDYGAFVAIDPTSGRILSLVSYAKNKGFQQNLALRASFPSASVFKVVTAAAAIEGRQVSANTVIPFNGRNHTLYRNQILKTGINRATRFMTLREAFARSVNTVFGRIGAYTVGSERLKVYADRFGFNRKIEADIPVEEGRALIPDDIWGLAEAASGFTRDNTMSPLQGALIAAAVANGGITMEPFVVQSMTASDGKVIYTAQPKVAAVTIDSHTASEIRSLMKETVLRGTSRSSFKGFFKNKEHALLDVGGKTGSLTGYDPKGKYDWFVGYADSGLQKIAVAALTIHEKQWRVKSSYLARRAIESHFKPLEVHRNTFAKR